MGDKADGLFCYRIHVLLYLMLSVQRLASPRCQKLSDLPAEVWPGPRLSRFCGSARITTPIDLYSCISTAVGGFVSTL